MRLIDYIGAVKVCMILRRTFSDTKKPCNNEDLVGHFSLNKPAGDQRLKAAIKVKCCFNEKCRYNDD